MHFQLGNLYQYYIALLHSISLTVNRECETTEKQQKIQIKMILKYVYVTKKTSMAK